MPPRRRRRRNPLPMIIAAAVVVILIVVLAIVLGGRGGSDVSKTPAVPQTQTVQTTDTNVTAPDDQNGGSHAESLQEMLASEDSQVEGLSRDQMVDVSDLAVNQGLSDEWMNVLLLGSDERKPNTSARTDSMIICSINTTTGQVKLTSIMRDLAVRLDNIGSNSGTYRINAANYFGGERLAMRVVNECFGLNITRYVRVNFYGFQQIAELLGGIEMDITEQEMEWINAGIVDQATQAYYAGIDESNLPNQLLETYGPNTHLDGRQTCAYARIRKIDSDYARADRQRRVLGALLGKVRGAGAGELLQVGMTAMNYISTNMTLDEILAVAIVVTGAENFDIPSFRLPMNDTFKQETRNNQDMLYDCDWARNSSELYTFIYG